VPRHGLGQQVQRSLSGWIPHDRITIPQIRPSRSLPLHRPRQSAPRYPAVAANRSSTHSVQRHLPLTHKPLPLRPTCWIGQTPITHRIRGIQIPIVNAAPPMSPPAVSSLGGLRTPAPVCAAPPSWGRHPQTFTNADIDRLRRGSTLTTNMREAVPIGKPRGPAVGNIKRPGSAILLKPFEDCRHPKAGVPQ
jgi:hypothetical protein